MATKKRAAQKTTDIHAVRLNEQTIARLDALIEPLTKAQPNLATVARGGVLTRAAVIKLALDAGLDVLERSAGKGRGTGRQ